MRENVCLDICISIGWELTPAGITTSHGFTMSEHAAKQALVQFEDTHWRRILQKDFPPSAQYLLTELISVSC